MSHRQPKSGMSSMATSVTSSAVSSRMPSRASSPGPSTSKKQPFRFFDLPSELRLRVYDLILQLPEPVDLHPLNSRQVHPRLALFLVSHRMHAEAYRVFYAQPVRLFPKHGRFFYTKKPLLTRLPPHYRAALTTLDLLLGPGFSAPPRCQNTGPALGLPDCTRVRTLRIFVECDPSHAVFAGFRGVGATEETYKAFCVELVEGVFEQVPGVETVEIDAYPAVKKEGPLIRALRALVEAWGRRVAWGPLRGWEKEGDEPGLIGLEGAMAGMGIEDTGGSAGAAAGAGRVVEVRA